MLTSMPVQGQFADEKGWRALANELRVRILEELAPTDLLSCLKVRINSVHFLRTLLTKTSC